MTTPPLPNPDQPPDPGRGCAVVLLLALPFWATGTVWVLGGTGRTVAGAALAVSAVCWALAAAVATRTKEPRR